VNTWFRRLFLVLSIGGGFLGFSATSGQLFQAGQPLLFYVLCIAVAMAYGSGIYGGLMLVEEEEKGLVILSWYFLAQVPIFISPIIAYQFSSGLTAYATIGTKGVSWAAFYGGRWQISLFQFGDTGFAAGINFFAVWAIWYLRKQLERVATSMFAAKRGAIQPSAANDPERS
jgi:hypothetical protein